MTERDTSEHNRRCDDASQKETPGKPLHESFDACIICLMGDPVPFQSGCACRGDAGLAHVECVISAAKALVAMRGRSVWWKCQTCNQEFTGPMRKMLALAWSTHPMATTADRLMASANEALYLQVECQWANAAVIQAKVLSDLESIAAATATSGFSCSDEYIQFRVKVTRDLSESLSHTGRGEDAIIRIMGLLRWCHQHLGSQDTNTLAAANDAALMMLHAAAPARAEVILRELLLQLKVTRGERHLDTLTVKNNLGIALLDQGKNAEAADVLRDALAACESLLGKMHPQTVKCIGNLADALQQAGDYSGAEDAHREALERSTALNDPLAKWNAAGLANALAAQGKRDAADTVTHSALVSAATLPIGSRVLVQRLVAKPEYNGMDGTVRSFNANSGRYVVDVCDGKGLLLKRENMRRVRCANSDCTTVSVATMMCSRCRAVWYCCKECQTQHWTAHRPMCPKTA